MNDIISVCPRISRDSRLGLPVEIQHDLLYQRGYAIEISVSFEMRYVHCDVDDPGWAVPAVNLSRHEPQRREESNPQKLTSERELNTAYTSKMNQVQRISHFLRNHIPMRSD